jgi:hypothetical protein
MAIVPREYFPCFLSALDLIEVGLIELILKELDKLGLLLKDLKGQGYNSGANMEFRKSE